MRCINYLSEYLVPVVLFYIVGFAVLQKRPVFDDFIEGALAGIKTVAGILPTLVGLMAAVGVLRFSRFPLRGAGGTGGISAYTGTGGSAASGASGVQFGGDGAALRYF